MKVKVTNAIKAASRRRAAQRTARGLREETAKMRAYFNGSFLVNDHLYLQIEGHLLPVFFETIFTARILKYHLNDCVKRQPLWSELELLL